MAATETAGGGFVREALQSRRLLGVALIAAVGVFLFRYDTGVSGGAKDRSLEEFQSDLGSDAEAALTREREPETAQV